MDGLDRVYGTTLQRIRWQRGSKSRLGIAVLMSLSLARRALHIDELRRSLAINEEGNDLNVKKVPSIQTLLGSCLGLAIFDCETSTVRLAHSVSMVPQGNTPRSYWAFPELPRTKICLTYFRLHLGPIVFHPKA